MYVTPLIVQSVAELGEQVAILVTDDPGLAKKAIDVIGSLEATWEKLSGEEPALYCVHSTGPLRAVNNIWRFPRECRVWMWGKGFTPGDVVAVRRMVR